MTELSRQLTTGPDWTEQLYRLLPAVYQIRDGEQRDVLRAYLQVIGEQAQALQDDVAGLYDNWFIETCDDWSVPYLGDLVGFRSAADAGEPADAVSARDRLAQRFLYPRREIANLVRRRRRKGTLSVLEDVARDVTGWPARAVEFWKCVHFFQNVQHPLPTLGGTLCVRDRQALARLNTPFDRIAHTVDLRAIQSLPGVGWYHPRKIGLFVWRRKVYSATNVRPFQICETHCGCSFRSYTFNRLGLESPLYVNPLRDGDEYAVAQEWNLPVPLYRYLLADVSCPRQKAATRYYGLGTPNRLTSVSIEVQRGSETWTLVSASSVLVRGLGCCQSRHQAACCLQPGEVAVDPECGRFVFGCNDEPTGVRVTYHYSFSADVGGGEYARPELLDTPERVVRLQSGTASLDGCLPLFRMAELTESGIATSESRQEWQAAIAGGGSTVSPTKPNEQSDCTRDRTAEKKATAVEWRIDQSVCIELMDNASYEIPAEESLSIADGQTLTIRSAPNTWPLLHLRPSNQQCGKPWRVQLGTGSRLVLDGLLICGATLQVEDARVMCDSSVSQPKNGSCCSSQRMVLSPNGDLKTVGVTGTLTSEVHVRHTTLVPGGGGYDGCQGNTAKSSLCLRLSNGRVCIQKSIVGTIDVEHADCDKPARELNPGATCPHEPIQLTIADSIVDAAGDQPAIRGRTGEPAYAALTIERSTVLGDVVVRQIVRAEDILFSRVVHVSRRGTGYMRFCYVPITASDWIPSLNGTCRCTSAHGRPFQLVAKLESESPYERARKAAPSPWTTRTPARFKCLPESGSMTTQSSCTPSCGTPTAPESMSSGRSPVPRFISLQYSSPGYCQLAPDCAIGIRQGAEDESEPGVFHDEYYPQREAALRTRLQDYTPAEMESAVIYADDLNPSASGTAANCCCSSCGCTKP